MKVYLLFGENEHDALTPIISKLQDAGYEPVHPGTVLVGESIVGEAQQVLASGIPIILFATVKTMGSEWTAKLVNAANSSGENRILVLKMDRDALVSHLTFGEKIADYSLRPNEALDQILAALKKRFGTIGTDRRVATDDEEAQYLDKPIDSTDVDSRAVEEFRSLLREELEDLRSPMLTSTEFMSRLLLLRKGRPTRAAALLFAYHPQIYVPSALVQCVQYFGISKEAEQDSVLLDGTIQQQLEGSFKFVASRIGRRDRPTPIGPRAISQFDYPMVCVREVLANAVVHRDYSDRARKVHVRLYSNRLEISSPGSWATERSPDTLQPSLKSLVGESVSRNPSLAHAMSLARYLESEGSGIPKALNDASQNGAVEPSVRFADGFTTVTIWPNRLDAASVDRLITSTRSDLRHRGFNSLESSRDFLIETRVSVTSSREVGSSFLNAQDIVALDTQCIVVTGGPGAGKTTFLKTTGRLLATANSRIPIFVSLRSMRLPNFSLEEFLNRLEEDWNRDLDLGVAPGFADALLVSRDITFLFDGLDEMADPAQRLQIVELVAALTQKYKQTRVIITGRTPGLPAELATEAGKRLVVNVEPWSNRDLYEFAQKFFESAGVQDVPDKAAEFVRAIAPGLQSLARNPLLATLLLEGFSQTGIVAGSVYELAKLTISSLASWDRQRGIASGPNPEYEAQHLLRHLALTSLEQDVSWNRMPGPWVEEALRGLMADRRSGTDVLPVFEALVTRQNILQEVEAKTAGTPTYSFTHIVFAELLAAQQLARQADEGASLVRSLLRFEHNQEFLQISYFAYEEWDRRRGDGRESFFNALLTATRLEQGGDDRIAATRIVEHMTEALWVLVPPKPGWRQDLALWASDADAGRDQRMRSAQLRVMKILSASEPAERGVDPPPLTD